MSIDAAPRPCCLPLPLLAGCERGRAAMTAAPRPRATSPPPTARSRRSSRPRWSTEEARDRVNEADDGHGLGRDQARHDRRRYRRGRGLLYGPPRAARRRARAACWPRISCPDDARRARPSASQRERLDNVSVKLGAPDDPQLPDGQLRPRVHGPHVSRDRRALCLPVAPAPGAAQRRAGDRRRRRPADRTAWHAPACSSASSRRSATSSCPTTTNSMRAAISRASCQAASAPIPTRSRCARIREDDGEKRNGS